MRLITGFILLMSLAGTASFAAQALAEEAVKPSSSENIFIEMLNYARLADAAYESKSIIENVARDLGYSVTQFEDLPDQKVTYYLATNEATKTHIIAVRGTANADNALLDIAIQLITNKDINVQLHEGFAKAAASIFNKIKIDLNKNYKIRITGHSLGGAVAMILAMYLDMENYSIERVVTFGQPKVTNVTGALKFMGLDIWRVVTEQDVVPLLPPLDPLDINNLDIYWHVGSEIILLEGSHYSVANNMESMLRATKFLNKMPSENNLLHHKMSYYLSLIESKQAKAEQVPYENDFSIFSSVFGNQ